MTASRRTTFARTLSIVIVVLVSGIYGGSLLYASHGYQASADSHYHFSVAKEIARGTFVPDVAYGLPFTILRELPVDHYWGTHLFIAPFAFFRDMELGMKAATLAMFVLVFASMAWLLEMRRVPYAWAWSLLPLLVWRQDWRYLQLRGGQLVIVLMFALIYAAFFIAKPLTRRILIVAIAYVAMLSYHGGVLLLPVHIAGTLGLFLFCRSSLQRRQVFEPVLTAFGLALGLTINPYMNAHFATWRFAAFHILKMGRDSANLYDDQALAEFHGFPLRLFFEQPIWFLFTVFVIGAAVMIFLRARSDRPPPRDTILFASLAILGIVLTSQAMRAREYSVPLAFAFLAILSRRNVPLPFSKLMATICAIGLFAGLNFHWPETLSLIGRHLPTNQFEGSLSLLEQNGDHPILNIAEADYCMLRWQTPKVVCVQGLSRYFLWPNQSVFHDVWELHDRVMTSHEVVPILDRFWSRGVRLMTTHKTHPMTSYADAHPELFTLVFRSAVNDARIYSLDRAGLDKAMAAPAK